MAAKIDAVPVTVSPEAAEYVREKKLDEPFGRIVNHIRESVPDLTRVVVYREPIDYGCPEDGERVWIEAFRDGIDPGAKDPVWLGLMSWLTDNYPPAVVANVVLEVRYGHGA
jgi:hypothetical protein